MQNQMPLEAIFLFDNGRSTLKQLRFSNQLRSAYGSLDALHAKIVGRGWRLVEHIPPSGPYGLWLLYARINAA